MTDRPECGTHRLDELADILSAAMASDALDALGHRNQVLGADIEPVCPSPHGKTVVGRAFPFATVRAVGIPEVPYVGLLAALDAVSEGDLVIVATEGAADVAVWGELLSTACKVRGARGVVTDGVVRDVREIGELGFAVFACGTMPNDVNGRLEVVDHGVEVEIDGVRIAPGDLVVADVDGVVVTPSELVDDVVALVSEKLTGESQFLDAIRSGMLPSEAFAEFGVL